MGIFRITVRIQLVTPSAEEGRRKILGNSRYELSRELSGCGRCKAELPGRGFVCKTVHRGSLVAGDMFRMRCRNDSCVSRGINFLTSAGSKC